MEDDTKTGCIEGDCQNGKGTYINADGDKYVGEFKDGKYNGQGTYTWSNKDKYVGEFKDSLFNGQGTFTWSDGRKYVGNWKDDNFNGQGTYIYTDGTKYVGEFKDDYFNGQGTYIYTDETKYVGEFKDDKYNGQGTYTNKSGCEFSGEWIDGELNGEDEFYYDEITNCTEKPLENKDTNEPKPESEPEIEKDYDFGGCTRITRKLYRQMREIVLGNREMEDLDTNEVVKLRTAVEKCVHKYYKQYEKEKPDFEKTVISSLMNVTPEMKIFELKFTPKQIRDIYGESRTMSLNNTIRKVIFESSEKKNLIKEEKKLIKNRFLFSINDLNLNNRRQFNESKKRLNNETINLIRRGYNQRLVKETLLDVMQSLYGGDGTNVITDFKTKLGEKIATQVKNKEEEHNMILSAFNELPEDMVERAIKEKRVDELSSEIATRAIEMYKGQYGTEGLSGLMFASVDENKFKQEVAKLLEPAINDITTKMDEKFKEIQNAVGGITKTA